MSVAVEPISGKATTAKDAARKSDPGCIVRGHVDDAGRVMLQLVQDAGALRDILGVRLDYEIGEPPAFAAQAVQDLVNIALAGQRLEPGEKLNLEAVNGMLQAAAAFEPTNELEGMFAIQAVVLHRVAMDALARGLRMERNDLRQAHLGQANKCSRTFAALVETLNRHRGKCTTQRVIVENVNVGAGGQAVVGAVQGVGSKQNGAVQAHGQTHTQSRQDDDCGARRPALPGPQSIGQAVPAAGEQGQEALPHARGRARKRGTEGKSEPARARPLQRRRGGDASRGACDAEERKGDARVNGAAKEGSDGHA